MTRRLAVLGLLAAGCKPTQVSLYLRKGGRVMMTRVKRLAALVCGATFFSSLSLAAAQPYIYPNQGQGPQQEQFDKGQCCSWAVQQTGFDPANPQVAMAPSPGMQAPQGGMFRGAAGGAALGAVGGAIGGDTGEGAAIGAGVGALFGGMRRARHRREEEQAQQSYAAQQQGAMAQGRSNYERAFGACMAGRGYTVR
jgi:YMGG-like Gly-zipper